MPGEAEGSQHPSVRARPAGGDTLLRVEGRSTLPSEHVRRPPARTRSHTPAGTAPRSAHAQREGEAQVKLLPVPGPCPATAPASTGSRKKKSERPGGPQGCSWGRGAMLGILERRAQ